MIHPVTLSRVTCHVSHGTHQTQSATGRGMEVSRASVENKLWTWIQKHTILPIYENIISEEEGTDYDKMTKGYK